MERFEGRIAVVTGGGTGMGRELALALTAEGCHVAICDVSAENGEETVRRCVAGAPSGTRATSHVADVADAGALERFRDEVVAAHETDHVHLLFNNAGVAGGGSFVLDEREAWDRTFAICWGGVYETTRVFLPLLMAAPEGHLVNTSSVNGFWASLGPNTAHTAYSAAKFAVKGFSEALINDFALHAPHLSVSVVMPGHIGTSIVRNSGKVLGTDPKELADDELAAWAERLGATGLLPPGAPPDAIRQAYEVLVSTFESAAPTSAADAAAVILDGVRAKRWRILVGHDAGVLDRLVREDPEHAYGGEFMERLRAETPWLLGS